MLFADPFTRPTDPGTLSPWVAQSGNWTVTAGTLQGGPNNPFSYSSAYLSNSWTNYSVQAQIRFSEGAYGGGLGGCLNPVTGSRYAAWVYPEGSVGGSSVLKLIKFQTWTTFGYSNLTSTVMEQVALTGVGTNWHTVTLSLMGTRITVDYDGVRVVSTTDTEVCRT